MKTIILSVCLLLLSVPAFSCLNKVSIEKAQKAISDGPEKSEISCKGAEECLCADGIEWDMAEIKNGKLVISTSKKAAYEAKIEADQLAKKEAHDKAEAIKLKFKSLKKSDIKNESDLKDLVLEAIELLK